MPFLLLIFLAFLGLAGPVSAEQTNYLSEDPLTSPRCNVFTFDSTGSYDPDDEKITVQWNFGDGSASNLPVIEHTYQASGDYQATLTISDHSSPTCCTSVVKQAVRVNIPPDASFAGPEKACTGEAVRFTNTSNETSVDAFSHVYSWDFGDGTRSSSSGAVDKIYAKGGSYKVNLSVDSQRDPVCSVRTFSKNIYVNQPPTAEAGDEVMEQCLAGLDQSVTVNFSAAKSFDENNDPLRYTWDFGDGTQGQGIQVAHTYNRPDNYDVKLVVSDQSDFSCNTSVDFIQLRIGVAPKADAGEAVIACPGDEVVFDGSNSYAQTKGTLSAQWDFSDGQIAEGLKTTHVYQKAGQYSAVLSVKSLTNQSCPESKASKSVLVNAPPVVTIADAKPSCIGQGVEFNATAKDPDGNTMEYYWTFGDGSIIRGGPKVTHEYQHGGRYRVSVIVDDGQKTTCSTGTAETMVKINTPPQGHIVVPAEIRLGTAANFDASTSSDPDGDNLQYQWDFGDGTHGEGVTASHIYKDRGSYQVKLMIDDNSGTSCSQGQDSAVAEAKSAPVAVMSIR